MIGLDISDRSIKVAQISNDTSRKVLALASKALEDGIFSEGIVVKPEQLALHVIDVFKKGGVKHKNTDAIVASIPETRSFLRVIEIPDMADDEIGEAVKWEVAQHIPFGLENVYLDWQPIASSHAAAEGRKEIQVGAAQNKVVDSLYTTLKTLNLDVAAFEMESQAIARALISKDLQKKEGLLIVDLGSSATNVIIHDHGAMRFTASLQKGVQYVRRSLSHEKAQHVDSKLNEMSEDERKELAQALMPAMNELALEVRGVVDFYNKSNSTHAIQEILLTGGGSNLPGLEQPFVSNFDNVHVQRGNPWVNLLSAARSADMPLGLKESMRFTTALGLAQRPVLI